MSFDMQLKAVDLSDVYLSPDGDILPEGVIKEAIVCLRPMRTGIPNISAGMVDDKLIVHNYGHGGSGWTLVWGCVERSIRLFKEQAQQYGHLKDVPITIIGAGVMGKATAIMLHNEGYNNISIVAEELDRIPSKNSTGYFATVSMAFENEQQARDIADIGRVTFDVYKQIAEGCHPFISHGARMVSVYTGVGKEGDNGPLETITGLEEYADLGLIPEPEIGTVRFSTGKHYVMKRFHTFFMDTPVLMEQLDKALEERSISINIRHIDHFSDVSTPVIFNNAGLGAKALNYDELIYPNLGLLLSLQNQPREALDYIIYTRFQSESIPDEINRPDKPDIYFMPKVGGLLGATFYDKNDGSDEMFNRNAFQKMLRYNQEFFGFEG